MIGLDRQRGALGGLGPDHVVPPEVAPVLPRHLRPAPPVHDHVLDGRARGHRLVRGALEHHRLPAAGEGVGGDEHPGAAAVQARGHRLGAVAREARGVHRADARHRQRRDHRLRAHRQQDAHRVARPDPEPLERVRETAHLGAQLPVGERPHRAVLRLRDHRGLVAAALGQVPVDAVVGEIEPAALEPAGPLDALRGIEHPAVGREPVEAQIARDRVPVPLGIGHRATLQLLEGGDAVGGHEPAHPGARGRLGVRPPDDLVGAHGIDQASRSVSADSSMGRPSASGWSHSICRAVNGAAARGRGLSQRVR